MPCRLRVLGSAREVDAHHDPAEGRSIDLGEPGGGEAAAAAKPAPVSGSGAEPPLHCRPPSSRGCGGIGRRARFRSVWGKPRGGSSPLIRITDSGRLCPQSAPQTAHAEPSRAFDENGAAEDQRDERGCPWSLVHVRHAARSPHQRNRERTCLRARTPARPSCERRFAAARPPLRRLLVSHGESVVSERCGALAQALRT
jgi:hypothetical protein